MTDTDLISAVADRIYSDWLGNTKQSSFKDALKRAVEAGSRLHNSTATGLTRSQRELLIYIGKYIEDKGFPPSFDEMKDAMGLNSKSGIHRLICGLEERGAIHRLSNRARSIEILRPAA